MSSNLISRSTVNAFTKSFLLQLILDTHIGYLGSFFLLYWKFSPYASYLNFDHACDVYPDGDVGYDNVNAYGEAYYSYGRKSPHTLISGSAWVVSPSGLVDNHYDYGVDVSYGHTFLALRT